MRRILHISNTDIYFDSRIRKELLALAAIDKAEISVIGVNDDWALRERMIDGALSHHLHLYSRILRFLPRSLRYIFELIEFTIKAGLLGHRIKPDVVHCHDTFALPSGWLLKKGLSCKIVYDAHELESNKNGQNFLLSQATLHIERFCWSQIDLLVSVSDSILDWYRDQFGPKVSILVLNSPVFDCQSVARSKTGATRRYFHELYDIPKDKLVFVYLGILGAGRGIEIALEAFSSDSLDAHLVLVGYGDLSSHIQSYCDRHRNIHLHNPVPHDQVVALVASADVGLCLVENVSLSDYYCLPNKLFEYSFAGLNVLASDFPEIRRVVKEYSLGACCQLDPEKVRLAIQSLVDHPPGRISTDLAELSWDTQAERLLGAYRKLLEPGN